jgi:voltage-gated potassium channel
MQLSWIRLQKWKLLLVGIVALLVISPVAQIYDDQDNIISPLMALLLLAVTFGLVRRRAGLFFLSGLIAVWLVISILTDGSGLFASRSLLAPLLFLVLLAVVFGLLLRWLIGAVRIDSEILCAGICGYLLIGLVWTGFDALALTVDPKAFTVVGHAPLGIGDLLYYSYCTLTTIGYGDIAPKNPFVRMASVLEAILGIFYNAILITRFVSLYSLRHAVHDRVNDSAE